MRQTRNYTMPLIPSKVSPMLIANVVAKKYHIKYEALLSIKRSRTTTDARNVAMTLTRDLTALSYAEISSFYNRTNHSTSIYAIKRINRAREKSVPFSNFYTHLYKIIILITNKKIP